jgi:hypothetical protein
MAGRRLGASGGRARGFRAAREADRQGDAGIGGAVAAMARGCGENSVDLLPNSGRSREGIGKTPGTIEAGTQAAGQTRKNACHVAERPLITRRSYPESCARLRAHRRYLIMIAVSIAAMVGSVTLTRLFVAPLGEWNANFTVAVCYIVVGAAAALLLPRLSGSNGR